MDEIDDDEFYMLISGLFYLPEDNHGLDETDDEIPLLIPGDFHPPQANHGLLEIIHHPGSFNSFAIVEPFMVYVADDSDESEINPLWVSSSEPDDTETDSDSDDTNSDSDSDDTDSYTDTWAEDWSESSTDDSSDSSEDSSGEWNFAFLEALVLLSSTALVTEESEASQQATTVTEPAGEFFPPTSPQQ
ncbi:hypothetical protein N7532_002588 [Penicillium argentinense]|uniref:Uncharacterized protein n=1 Tax=Penicillium argentinense TaxID=1131581 RepID=A0A9W9G0N6_9EURO|nr:uncharacterized protein N7532_002588 [Penicillium argentinense]KAJ5109943.1 hypothetical protein N7532_002588 [Penicillium argentinense]